MIKTNLYKILSILLSYPTQDLKNNITYIKNIIEKDNLFSIENKNILIDLIIFIDKNDLIYLQEYYVSIFDRKRDFSLYIFEHIHGDSRERGMAMIDLINLYKKNKLKISKKNELPDYIPLFLEYLALLNKNKAENLIGEIINIVAILERRLKLIDSNYHIIFKILEDISPIKCDSKTIDKIIKNFKNYKNNNTIIDKDWEEPKAF